MKVNIDVDLARDVDSLRAHIIEAIANKVLYGVSYDEDGDPHSVPTKVSYELRDAMAKEIKEETAKHVGPAVEAALAEGVQRTDQYGDPRGEKVPLRTVIIEEAQKVFGQKVEYRDGYGRHESLISSIIRNEVQKAVAEDLKAAIKDERAKVQQAVRNEAAAILTESVRRAVPAL